MNKIKKSIKYYIKIIFRIYFFKEFLYLITRIVDNDFYKINANGNNYFFSKSGKLNEYRIKTFVTKEPETIDWINKFEPITDINADMEKIKDTIEKNIKGKGKTAKELAVDIADNKDFKEGFKKKKK